MTTQEIIEGLQNILSYCRYHENAPALREAIRILTEMIETEDDGFCPLSEMPDVDSLNVQIAYIKGKTDGIKECTEKLHKARMEFAERREDGQTT